MQGESKKSVICGAWCKIVPFYVQLSCMEVFQKILKICNFFWYFNGPKKIRVLFFSQNQKFIKTTMCEYIVSIEI